MRKLTGIGIVLLTLIATFSLIGTAVAAKGGEGKSERGRESKVEEAAEEVREVEHRRIEDEEELGEGISRKEKLEKAEGKAQKQEEKVKKGLEKQRGKKMEQEQKELDKGSEQGQKMREEHRKKWWKFWGE